MTRQPKAVWAVAFACVVAFMGIGLVDPILPALASQLDASPSQVELLFTSYFAFTGVSMLVTGWVSSRIGPRRTLLAGLALVVVFAALAGASGSVAEIVGFRAGWGLGNALFIATALAVIIGAASGGVSGAIRALRHRGLLVAGLVALFYNFGFFTLLAYTPFPLHMGAHALGAVFFGWGLMVAVFSVFVAPRVRGRLGVVPTLAAMYVAIATLLVVMAIGESSPAVLATCVIVAGAFLGVINTVLTETVMKVSPVERPVASSAYSYLRFAGGAIAPYLAGKLAEGVSLQAPFLVGAGAVLIALAILLGGRRHLTGLPEPLHARATAGERACRIRAKARAGNVGPRAMDAGVARRLDAGMDKKPQLPPHHRAYPRARPVPARPGAAPRPGASPYGATTWSRAVPEGRRFPRGG